MDKARVAGELVKAAKELTAANRGTVVDGGGSFLYFRHRAQDGFLVEVKREAKAYRAMVEDDIEEVTAGSPTVGEPKLRGLAGGMLFEITVMLDDEDKANRDEVLAQLKAMRYRVR